MSFTLKTFSYQRHATICGSYSPAGLNKNAYLKPNKYIEISMSDVQRKHSERNIISYETDECTGQQCVAYKSVRQSNDILKRDRESILVPRKQFLEKNVNIVSSYYNQGHTANVFKAYPILENHHYTYLYPLFPESRQTIDPTRTKNYNDQKHLPRNPLEEYQEYSVRKRTFEEWAYTENAFAEKLCKAGFFYTGCDDKIRCCSCGLGLKDLAVDSDPDLEHVRHSSSCSFLSEHLGEERLTGLQTYLCMSDVEYYRKWQCKDNFENKRLVIHAPNYEKKEDRLASFSMWPLTRCSNSVAETGLYYTGFEADVRCFACDGGLRKLKSVDELWLDHCFFFPSCAFMEAMAGQRFLYQLKEISNEFFSKEETTFIASGGAKFRENRESLKKQCLEMGFFESDIDKSLMELVLRGYRHNIGPLLDLLSE